MRLIINLIVICMIAAGVGLGLTFLAVRHPLALDVIQDGAWEAIANEGGPDVDAYALAALAHRGEAPLSIADGLTFRASEDEDGNPLSGACSYVISGALPPVRVWSLSAFDRDGRPFPNPAGRYGYSNADAMRDSDGAIRIALSAEAQPGDWIPVASDAPKIMLELRLYDTTAAAISGGRSAPELPAIKRTGCRS
ncbi:hypothetical protein IZ6_10120 [Terrihabitans soli]|uniref:DUF1214 domain-containing protein n=1 Tax=Terrihabitans soli TaxID=708113 RepID=A0A6S6QQN1_9HYPH|nr:DUF1214 domain-containing protein [Terrihabitans soli]BCJ90277.1 hypothetical protein IZ6_10120 [Terrihabitans soli]